MNPFRIDDAPVRIHPDEIPISHDVADDITVFPQSVDSVHLVILLLTLPESPQSALPGRVHRAEKPRVAVRNPLWSAW